MADKKISQLTDGGAPQATDEFVVDRAGTDNFKIDFASIKSAAEATVAGDLAAHIADPTDAHDASAISNVPAGIISATDVQAAIDELAGEIPASLAGAVILAPASSARNVIQPTAGAVIAAIIKAHASQSVDLLEFQSSGGTPLASFLKGGQLSLTPTVTNLRALTIVHQAAFEDYQEAFGIYRGSTSFANNVFSVYADGSVVMFQKGIFSNFEVANVAASTNEIFRVYSEASDIHANTGVYSGYDKEARPFTAINYEPADADIKDGWLYEWFDATNGDSYWITKGKTFDGTVVEYKIPVGEMMPEELFNAKGDLLSASAADSPLILPVGANGFVLKANSGTATGLEWASDGLSAYVPKSLYDANTVLAANTDDTPAAVTMGAATILARLAAGNIKAASVAEIVTLLQAYTVGGTDVALADGGTGASLTDPNADRIMFWDDSAGVVTWLTAGSNLTITGTTLDATGGGGAPTTATYITQTPDAGLSAEQALSALATGLLKSTTGTGVLSIAGSSDYVAPSLIDAKGDLLVGTANDTIARQAVGSNGQVLRADSNQTPGVSWAKEQTPYGNWMPFSGKIETCRRQDIGSGSVAAATGTLYLIALPFPLLAGVTYTSITFISNGAASVPTNWWFTLVNKADMKTLRSTADQTTTAWGGTTAKTVNLSSTYTPTTDIDAYVGFMMKATTPVTFRNYNGAMQIAIMSQTPIMIGTSNTGASTPLADGTTVTAISDAASTTGLWYAVVS